MRSRPDFACWITVGIVAKIICAWPPITSVIAGELPL